MIIFITKIESEILNIVNYDTDIQKLTINFKKGGNTYYHYADVPLSVLCDFLAAPSKGSFFHSQIKNKYQYIKG